MIDVPVKLGTRSYRIVVGRGALATVGAELVAGESYVEVLRRLSMCGIGIETGG
jgi:hypothetical protein